MINKLKEFFQEKSIVGHIVLVSICLQLLVLTTFIELKLPIPVKSNYVNVLNNLQCDTASLILNGLNKCPQKYKRYTLSCADFFRNNFIKQKLPVRHEIYTPQVPIAMLVLLSLDIPLNLLTYILFILVGLLGPKFNFFPLANGGGLNYIFEPSFGYILGVLVSGFYLSSSKEDDNFIKYSIKMILSLCIINSIGVIGLIIDNFFSYLHPLDQSLAASKNILGELIRNFTWYQLPYDIVLLLLMFPLLKVSQKLVDLILASDFTPPISQSKSLGNRVSEIFYK